MGGGWSFFLVFHIFFTNIQNDCAIIDNIRIFQKGLGNEFPVLKFWEGRKMEELKKLLLATVGAATLSLEKVDATVQDLIERGKLSVKEGKELREELLQRKKDAEPETLTAEKLDSILESLNFAGRREVEALEERVRILEEKIRNLDVK
jgi:polyhydroxyalkanoate synthesis regulator phasin